MQEGRLILEEWMPALVRVASTKWMLGGILTTFCKDECEMALPGGNILHRDFNIPSGEYMPRLDFYFASVFFPFFSLFPYSSHLLQTWVAKADSGKLNGGFAVRVGLPCPRRSHCDGRKYLEGDRISEERLRSVSRTLGAGLSRSNVAKQYLDMISRRKVSKEYISYVSKLSRSSVSKQCLEQCLEQYPKQCLEAVSKQRQRLETVLKKRLETMSRSNVLKHCLETSKTVSKETSRRICVK